MRRTLVILGALVTVLSLPTVGRAASVLVLQRDGRVAHRNDRFLPAQTPGALSPAPAGPTRRALARSGGAGVTGGGAPVPQPEPKPGPAPVTVSRALAGLRDDGSITDTQFDATLGAFNAALAAERRLSGTRRAELADVTTTVHTLAATHALTASRLPALTALLQANRRWWTTGSLLSSGARVEFAGSQLVWEYYPGQGLQLQVLGTFGKADGLYTAGAAQYPAMEDLLAEMIPLASRRAGGTAWEYYFSFDGGAPPWASAMAQATGLEALTRAYEATQSPYYLQVAASAMPLFSAPPPQGVQVRTARGVRFLQYTFAPRLSILNAFLQTLIGLDDYAQVSHNATAAWLFAAGNAEARWEVPQFDTGAWSDYSPGLEDTLSYHELVTGFLQGMCLRTAAPVYCTTAQRFADDLTVAPTLTDLTARVKPGHAFSLRFALSKVSHVGVTIARGGHTAFATSASFPRGIGRVTVPKLARGSYAVTLTATDPAGNFVRVPSALTVAG